MALLIVASVVVVAMMSGRARRRQAVLGAGRGLGRGRGITPNRGVNWNRDGEHAKYILRGYLANNPNFATWSAFKRSHSQWIISATNESGYYTNDNLRRNYNNTIKRYQDHIDPETDYDGERVL